MAPARLANVGNTSSVLPSSCTTPGFTLPGPQKIAGSRMPPSRVPPLAPRNKPAEPPCVLKTSHGPLSDVNNTIVFLSSFSLRSVFSTWPTDQSISEMTSP